MITSAVLKELRSIVGEENCLDRLEDRVVYSTCCFTSQEPEVEIVPGNVSEVAAVLNLATVLLAMWIFSPARIPMIS